MANSRILRGTGLVEAALLLVGCSGPDRVFAYEAGAGATGRAELVARADEAGAAGAATRNVAALAGRAGASSVSGVRELATGEAGSSAGGDSGENEAGSGVRELATGGEASSTGGAASSGACAPVAGAYRVGPCRQEPGTLATGCARETHCIWDESDTVCGCEACSWADGYAACSLSEPEDGAACDVAANAVLCVYVSRWEACECVVGTWACEAIPCPSEAP